MHEARTPDDQVAASRRPGGPPARPGGAAAYSSKYSRKDFTQHQLFAVLALETFLRTDYRGVVAALADFAELRADLGLKKVPDHSTPCYAEQRLLKKGTSSSSSSAPPRPQRTAA